MFLFFNICYDFFSQSGEHTASPSKPQIEPAQPLQKTRRLPSWLMESTSSEAKSSLKKEGNRKGKAPAGEVLNVNSRSCPSLKKTLTFIARLSAKPLF